MSVVDRINQVSIPHKIIGAFFAILVLIGGLATISIGRVSATNAAIHELIDDHVSSLTFLDEMRSAVEQYRARLDRAVSSPGGEVPALALAGLDALEKSYEENETRYAPTVWGGDEAAIHDRMKPLASAFFAGGKAIAAALRDGKQEAAKTRLSTDLAPTADALDQILRDDFRFNSEGALTDAALVAQSIDRGLLNWIAVLIAVIVFVGAAGVFLFASIARPSQRAGDGRHGLAGADGEARTNE